ncbi:MAG TPA: biotin/lipoyl-containing protein, partial [Gaiellaceae bacterium]
MATEVKLPRLGQGMESGTIVKWLKSEGEQVQKGDALYELDTDKVTQEVEAEASGVLLKIAIPEGEVEVGRTIGFIGDAGEDIAESSKADSPEDSTSSDSATSVAAAAKPTTSDVPAAATNGSSQGRVADAEPHAAAPQQASGGRIKASP